SLWRRLQALLLEPGQDEPIYRIPYPSLLPGGGQLGPRWRDVRPMRVPCGAFGDPPGEERDLACREGMPRVGRRHVLVRIVVRNPLDEPALSGVAWDDDAGSREGSV